MKGFSVALVYVKSTPTDYNVSLTHAIRNANSEEEALGMAIKSFDEDCAKNGLSGYSLLIKEVIEIKSEDE